MRVLSPPNEPLPSVQMSVKDYVRTAQRYVMDGEGSLHDVLPFILAGRMPATENEPQRRVFVNCTQDALLDDVDEISSRRDYDSIIGISKDLPFTAPLGIYPTPRFEDSLNSNNHCKYKLTLDNVSISPTMHATTTDSDPLFFLSFLSQGQEKDVHLRRIPNCGFGKVETRHITRLFFPKMFEPHGNGLMTQAQFALLYNKCVQPIVVELWPTVVEHWPPSYAAALELQRDEHGKICHKTVDCQPVNLVTFNRNLRARLEQYECFQDSFYLHEWKGLKGASHHAIDDVEGRQRAYEIVTRSIDFTQVQPDNWKIDVAIELSMTDSVLQWRKSCHGPLLQYILPNVDQEHIQALLRSTQRFDLDISAHLGDLAGFRCEPRSDGTEDNVSYVNVYTTDKEGTYQLHKGLFARRSVHHLLPRIIDKLLADLDRMGSQLRLYASEESSHDGNCRLEIRVPLSLHDTVLLEFPDRLILHGIARYHYKTWWFVFVFPFAYLPLI